MTKSPGIFSLLIVALFLHHLAPGKKVITPYQQGNIELRILNCNTIDWGCGLTLKAGICVVLKNNTDSIACFYEDWNLWGYDNLNFEIKIADKVYHYFNWAKNSWDKNFPSYKVLNPGDSLIFTRTQELICRKTIFPCLTAANYDSVKIRAIYELPTENHTPDNFEIFRKMNSPDKQSAVRTYQSFPTSRISSIEYKAEIKNGQIQLLPL